ncbi:hypothetical protein FB451DRAFT_1214087 [Mycena latifolia]|nr:hypothetical protein FB451DRAFT_1214087 [Mycena latifolia]
MHESLRLDILSRLPARLRNHATKALSVQGPLQDLDLLCELIGEIETHHSRLFLPVFYETLCALQIPTSEDLEAYMLGTHPGVGPTIARALLALRGVAYLQMGGLVVDGACFAIWSVAWQWIEWFHGYWADLPLAAVHNKISESTIYELFVTLLLALGNDPHTAEIIDGTRGVRVILSRAWVTIIESPDGGHKRPLRDISQFLRYKLKPARREHFDELLEGVGGTLFDLGSIIVKHIRCVVPAPDSPISEQTISFLAGIFILFSEAPHHDRGGKLRDALLAHGIVPTLITLLHALAAATTPRAINVMFSAFSILSPMLTAPADHHHLAIVAALKSGLIFAIVTSALKNDHSLDLQLQNMLRTVLPGGMVYRPVLIQLKEAFYLPADLLAKLKNNQMSDMFTADWRIFVSGASTRLRFLETFEASESAPLRACDNLECGIIRPKADFRRCAGCRTLHYCSRDCQGTDWRIGGHRAACQHFLSFTTVLPEPLGVRDRSFMRALLHDQYQKDKRNVLFEQIKWTMRFPNERFYVRFDFNGRDGRVAYGFVGGNPGGAAGAKDRDELHAHWDEHLARAAKSRGQLELHVMRVASGGGTRQRIFPLRSASSLLYDGIRKLVEEFSAREQTAEMDAELRGRVDDLLALEVQQIHC